MSASKDGPPKRKRRRTTARPPLPPPPGLVYNAPPHVSFYVGHETYRLVTAADRLDSVRMHQHYVQYAMNNVYGFLTARNCTTEFGIRSNQAKIIAFLFKTILVYNRIVSPYRFRLYECDNAALLLGEPVVFVTRSGDTGAAAIDLYFSKTIVDRLVDAGAPNVGFRYSDDVKEDANKNLDLQAVGCAGKGSSSSSSSSHEQFAHQDLIFRLFIIADHLATHYIDEYISGQTDWINHYRFGCCGGPATTTHIVFKLTSAIVRNASTRPVLFNTTPQHHHHHNYRNFSSSPPPPFVNQIENPVTEPSALLRQLY